MEQLFEASVVAFLYRSIVLFMLLQIVRQSVVSVTRKYLENSCDKLNKNTTIGTILIQPTTNKSKALFALPFIVEKLFGVFGKYSRHIFFNHFVTSNTSHLKERSTKVFFLFDKNFQEFQKNAIPMDSNYLLITTIRTNSNWHNILWRRNEKNSADMDNCGNAIDLLKMRYKRAQRQKPLSNDSKKGKLHPVLFSGGLGKNYSQNTESQSAYIRRQTTHWH